MVLGVILRHDPTQASTPHIISHSWCIWDLGLYDISSRIIIRLHVSLSQLWWCYGRPLSWHLVSVSSLMFRWDSLVKLSRRIQLDLHRISVCNVLSLYCKNGVVGDKSLIHGAYWFRSTKSCTNPVHFVCIHSCRLLLDIFSRVADNVIFLSYLVSHQSPILTENVIFRVMFLSYFWYGQRVPLMGWEYSCIE